MYVREDSPVAELVAAVPTASQLFDLLGIDYACHGKLTLREACAEAALDPSFVRRSLEQLPDARGNARNWLDAPLEELLTELRDRRHPQLHIQLREVAALLSDACSGPFATRSLESVRCSFHHLCDLVEPHCVREEHVLFPVVQHLEDCWRAGEPPTMNYVGGLSRPLSGLVLEHERIVAAVDALSSNAVLAAGDGEGAARVATAVARLAHEVHEHIHLENNILFPRATALELAAVAPALEGC
jgi:regulator of cell morphogenesis and NO signaling